LATAIASHFFFVLVVETLAMAYARFGRESDLYGYEQADLVGLRCNSMKAAQRSRRRSEMLRHMEEQRRAGDQVPRYACDELRADMAKDGDVIKQ